MKVDNPRFTTDHGLECADCPYADKTGLLLPAFHGKGLCHPCPTRRTYKDACKRAEEEL